MGRRVGRIAATALLVAGCGGGAASGVAAAPVGNVADHDVPDPCVDAAGALLAGVAHRLPGVDAQLVVACHDDAWSAAAMACMRETPTDCMGQLSSAQIAGISEVLLRSTRELAHAMEARDASGSASAAAPNPVVTP